MTVSKEVSFHMTVCGASKSTVAGNRNLQLQIDFAT